MRKDLDREWTSGGTVIQKWGSLVQKCSENQKKSVKNVPQDIIFQYSYPRVGDIIDP